LILIVFYEKLSGWWLMRYLYVHQRVLEESSQLLHSAFLENIIGKIDQLEESLGDNLLFSSLLQLELGYTYLLYGEVQKTKLHFEKANEIVGFRCEWTGRLQNLKHKRHPKYVENVCLL
jgi:hypothetical protein